MINDSHAKYLAGVPSRQKMGSRSAVLRVRRDKWASLGKKKSLFFLLLLPGHHRWFMTSLPQRWEQRCSIKEADPFSFIYLEMMTARADVIRRSIRADCWPSLSCRSSVLNARSYLSIRIINWKRQNISLSYANRPYTPRRTVFHPDNVTLMTRAIFPHLKISSKSSQQAKNRIERGIRHLWRWRNDGENWRNWTETDQLVEQKTNK